MSFKILVCQIGARRRYAVPKIINELGLLECLYTDSSDKSYLGKLAKIPLLIISQSIQRLANRNIKNIPDKKIFSTDISFLLNLFFRKSGSDFCLWEHKVLSRRFIKKGIRSANVVYSMYHGCLDFVEYAKMKGCLSLIDVYIAPNTNSILAR